jgi:hypothetical protein
VDILAGRNFRDSQPEKVTTGWRFPVASITLTSYPMVAYRDGQRTWPGNIEI